MAELGDFYEQWRRLVNKAFGIGHGVLSAPERVWFNAQLLVQAIDDGGLISYYYNSPADTVEDCLNAMDVLGARKMKRLLIQVNGLFPDGVPADITARNEVINSWPDDGSVDDFLEPIEESAASEARKLEKQLVIYIERQGLGV